MLSKSAARTFFLAGTVLCAGAFILLTIDTVQRVPKQTNKANLTESAIRGKHLFDKNNCMGCHTILGEGAYYAPELTKVFDRRGPEYIAAAIRDPDAMFKGSRRMVKYDLSEEEISDLVAFLKWIGEMDLNGFPPEPDRAYGVKTASAATSPTLSESQIALSQPPKIFNQMCLACHALNGSGGTTGPALDGIGSLRDTAYLVKWIKDPQSIKPASTMPKLPVSDEDIQAIADFLSTLK